jgi:FkbM family methyltransferase
VSSPRTLLKRYCYVPYDVFRSLKYLFLSNFVSEFGEDRLLKELFLDVDNGVYLDIGCHHPYRESNTLFLRKSKGWTGINLDVSEVSIRLFNIFRPSDLNLNIGIGDKTGIASYFEFSPLHCQNTFDRAVAENVRKITGQSYKESEVPISTIDDILTNNNIRKIDYINIDAEGLDTIIFRSFPFSRIRPRVITLEAHCIPGSIQYASLDNLAKTHGYMIISICGPTIFLVDEAQIAKNKWNFFSV